MKILLLTACLFLTSCATKYYSPPNTDKAATVSFSNLSPEIPEINIIDNCTSLKINDSYFENKKPTDISEFKINIPIKRKISFVYNYFWISGEKTVPITIENSTISLIRIKKIKVIHTCNEIVTFIPEKNRHYEVYFGKNIENCMIKASEAYYTDDKHKKQLMAIHLVSDQEC